MSAATLEFNPLSPQVLRDPYAFYDRFRSQSPIYRSEAGFLFLTRHEDVAQVLRNKRFGKSFSREAAEGNLDEPVHRAASSMLIYLNPPSHTRIRNLVTGAFSMKNVDRLRSVVESLAHELVDKVIDSGRMDLVRDFAFQLPLIVICELLDVPVEDRWKFFATAATPARALDLTPMTADDLRVANERIEFLESYFLDLLVRRRETPGLDLVTGLLASTNEGSLTEREILSNIILLFRAGYETTAGLIGNAYLAIASRPEHRDRVIEDPSLLEQGVEELFRFDTSVQFSARTALEDAEIAGHVVRKGETVLPSLGAANRDPDIFENPNDLIFERRDVNHLSFGGGVHYCLGAQLSRMELCIALKVLFERLPGARLANPDNIEWRRSFLFRGLSSLPLTW